MGNIVRRQSIARQVVYAYCTSLKPAPIMSVPDPISLLQSVLLVIDYGNQLAGAGKDMTDYCKMINKTSDLVEEIRMRLKTLGHLFDDQDMASILQELQEVDEELEKARGLVARIEKRRPQWSKNVTWVFKNKSAAQEYGNAVAKSHSALNHIKTRLMFMRSVPQIACSDDTPGQLQHTASPSQSAPLIFKKLYSLLTKH